MQSPSATESTPTDPNALNKMEKRLQELTVIDGELWTLPKDRAVYEQRLPGRVLFRVVNREAVEKQIRNERIETRKNVESMRAALAGKHALDQALQEEQETRSGGILGETVTRPYMKSSK